MMPRVSVVIPTFNRWPLLAEAVDSVLSQSYRDFELIVVDDGSNDATPRELAKMASRLRVLSTPRKGVAAARNLGVSQACGRYVAFLDSDDLWLSTKLEKQTQFMQQHPEFHICQTDEIWIRNGVRVNPKSVHQKPSGDIFFRSLELCLVSPSAVMMTKALFERTGGFDEAFPVCEDYDLWLRISAQRQVALIPDRLTIKRGGHADQLSRSVWGMDRYRILALQKLLSSNLNRRQEAAAIKMLRQKVAIVAGGARKRGREEEARTLEALVTRLEQEKWNGRERDSGLREPEGISSAHCRALA
ncbi:MAG TPA: glycosyltransferase family A protein [Candidatus Binatia bacterium]